MTGFCHKPPLFFGISGGSVTAAGHGPGIAGGGADALVGFGELDGVKGCAFTAHTCACRVCVIGTRMLCAGTRESGGALCVPKPTRASAPLGGQPIRNPVKSPRTMPPLGFSLLGSSPHPGKNEYRAAPFVAIPMNIHSHQTGWTALVAKHIPRSGNARPVAEQGLIPEP
jgi:hypothetical protein